MVKLGLFVGQVVAGLSNHANRNTPVRACTMGARWRHVKCFYYFGFSADRNWKAAVFQIH
jgi:hypothetical protein